MHSHTHTYTHTHTNIHNHTHIHIYTHTYTHPYTNTHIHTQRPMGAPTGVQASNRRLSLVLVAAVGRPSSAVVKGLIWPN